MVWHTHSSQKTLLQIEFFKNEKFFLARAAENGIDNFRAGLAQLVEQLICNQ